MIIRAIVDIPAGEEVVYSYVPLYQSTKSRKAQLQSAYGFNCTCARCLSGNTSSDPSSSSGSVPAEDQSVEYASGSAEDLLLTPLKDLLRDFAIESATGEEQMSLETSEAWISRLVGALHTLHSNPSGMVIKATNKNFLQIYATVSKLAAGIAMPPSSAASANDKSKRLLHTALLGGLLSLGCIYRQISAVELEAVQIELSLAYVCQKLVALHSAEETKPISSSEVHLDLSELSIIGESATAVERVASRVLSSETLFSAPLAGGEGSAAPSSLFSVANVEWSELTTTALSQILTTQSDVTQFTTKQTDSALYAELSSVILRYASERHVICRGVVPQQNQQNQPSVSTAEVTVETVEDGDDE
eukprot:gene25970-32482_t